jgi:hypothetical protein
MNILYSFTLGIRDLGIQYGCIHICDLATRISTLYKQQYLLSLPQQRHQYVNFNKLIYIGCAFYLAAKKMKCIIDKKRLQDQLNCNNKEFINILTSMSTLCTSLIGQQKKSRKKKEKNDNEENDDNNNNNNDDEDTACLDGEELDDEAAELV